MYIGNSYKLSRYSTCFTQVPRTTRVYDPFNCYTRFLASTRDSNREAGFEVPMLVCKAYVHTIFILSEDIDLHVRAK